MSLHGVVRQKWQEPSAYDARKQRRLDTERAYKLACALVDRRDEGRCRVCGRYVSIGLRHHHHIVERSKGRDDSTSNLVLLCGDQCHREAHGNRKLRFEGNADVALAIYRRGEDGLFFLWRQETSPRVYVGAL